MTAVAAPDPPAVMHDQFAAEIARMRRLLDGEPGDTGDGGVRRGGEGSGRLDEAAVWFGLTAFERDLLMLCAAVELDGGVAAASCRATASPDPRPTAGLALTRLPGSHWDALLPDAPLRAWRLVEVSGGETLVNGRVSIDERVLHHLLGLPGLDPRLDGAAVPMPVDAPLYRSHRRVVEALATSLLDTDAPALVVVDGADEPTHRAVAAALLDAVGVAPLGVISAGLPGPGPALHDLTRLIDREWILARRLPVLTGVADNPHAVAAMLEITTVPVVVVLDGPAGLRDRAPSRVFLHAALEPPTPLEQSRLWTEVLDGPAGAIPAAVIEDVAQRHRFGAGAVVAMGRELSLGASVADPAAALADLCRGRSRARLDGLAQRLEVRAGWDDLVLPPGHLQVLRAIARQVGHRTTVYDRWGFGDRTSRGLGVTALFSGESGTGKTLAAEVIANHLSLDLYRVDLAATVSKYIGETEKNLARLFDAAEGSGAILLFDEADALFGKRTEVRDGHDRYANLEVAYLLQRMETYRGLAILTTNLRSNLDRAFLRRLRFVVQFPFPDEAQRAEIWRRMFPAQTPIDGIDPEALARLAVPGGSIWSIALGAAFAAAEAGTAVTPAHILEAARTEYAKHDRTLTDAEMGALR